MLSWAPLRWWLTMDVFRTITTGSPLGQVRFLNVLVSLAVARNGLLIWPLAGARGALVQRTIKRLHNAASVVWVYHLLCLTGLEQYIASFLMDHLSRKIKSPFMMIGESAFWSLLEQTRHVLVYPFNVVKWLGCLFCGLCLVLLEVAFYISPLVLLAATWIVVYYELYEAFCLSRSLQNGSLCRFSQLRDLVDEYLLEHELDCTHQLLQPTIERLAANTEGGFHADFFLRILQLHSDKMLDIANGCEREVTYVNGTDNAAEREKHLLRHVAAFLRRHALTKPERVNPVEHPGLFLIHAPRALSGILVKYILRFPSLKHLEHTFHFAYLLPFLLSIPGAFLVLHFIRFF